MRLRLESLLNLLDPVPATLRDRWRPLVGGLKIQLNEEGLTTVHTCTLGFIAMRDR